MAKTKIQLEDNGQDILWFLCDEHGLIIDASPFQSDIWKGGTIPIWDDELMMTGKPCPIHNAYIKQGYLKYKIEKIEII